MKTHETPDWFRDAKFGIYFHWGSWCNVDDPDWEKFLRRLRNVCLRLAIASIEILGHTGSLAWEMTDDAVLVEMPAELPCEHAFAPFLTLIGVSMKHL